MVVFRQQQGICWIIIPLRDLLEQKWRFMSEQQEHMGLIYQGTKTVNSVILENTHKSDKDTQECPLFKD